MWGAEWTGGSLPPASGSSKLCDCEEPPQHVSVASRVSRGISRFPPSFPKHRAAQKFPLQLLQILWKITEAGFSMTATHPKKKERKKPTTSHVITPSEKTSHSGLCWASQTHSIMREQNICQGSSNLSLPAQRYSEISKFTAKCYLEFLWYSE